MPPSKTQNQPKPQTQAPVAAAPADEPPPVILPATAAQGDRIAVDLPPAQPVVAPAVQAALKAKQAKQAQFNTKPYEQVLKEKDAKGLLCPNKACKSARSKVLDTKPQENNLVVRHRECLACGHRWKTTES